MLQQAVLDPDVINAFGEIKHCLPERGAGRLAHRTDVVLLTAALEHDPKGLNQKDIPADRVL
jgi:hypothetical protein